MNKEAITAALARVALANMPGACEREAELRVRNSVVMDAGEVFIEVVLMRQAYGERVLLGRREFRSFGLRAVLMVHVDAAFADELLQVSIDVLEREEAADKQAAARDAIRLARIIGQAVG